MTWTHFWDMHSGGDQKLDWPHIFIEAPEAEAKIIFYSRFGRNPERVTCTCCGDDYSISESPTIEVATAYHRNCLYVEDARRRQYRGDDVLPSRYLEPGESVPPGYVLSGMSEITKKYHPNALTVAEYLASGKVCVIRADEIKPEERVGEVPPEGYIWT